MGENTRTRLDDLVARLDRLEAENNELRERLDEAPKRLSRRMLLGGGAAAGAAIAAGSVSPAAAAPAPAYVELDEDENLGPAALPTGIRGVINAPLGERLDLFTAAFKATNLNETAGCGLLGFGYTVGVNALSQGEAVFAKCDGGGIGVHGYVYGGPPTTSRFASGVWGQSSIDDAPSFLSDAKITLRTLENEGGMPESDDAKPGDLSIRTDPSGTSTWWVCVKEADGVTPAEFLRLAAPGAAGAFEALPAPIRVYDSRPGTLPATGPKTPIDGGTERVISCEENTAGQVPGDARAVLVNLTIANPTGAGWAALFADGATWGGTSNVNFTAGQVIANSATVGCGSDAGIRVRIGEAGLSADVIVDVMGLFR